MNRKLTTALLLVAACLSVAAIAQRNSQRVSVKASNKYVTVDIVPEDVFDEIKLLGSPDVEYRISPDGLTRLRLHCSDNVVEHVRAEVRNGILHVSYRDNVSISGSPKTKIIAESPSLKAAYVTGSGDIELKGGITGKSLALSVTGSGDIEAENLSFEELSASVTGSGDIELDRLSAQNLALSVTGSGDLEATNIEATKVAATVSGSGDMKLSGTTQEASFMVAGSGDLVASGLQAVSAETMVRGSGSITCHATGKLAATATGSGTISYRGNPELQMSGRNVRRID